MTAYAAIFKEATEAAEKAIADEVAREPENQWSFDCGFAWVIVEDGRHPFINWCKAQIKELGGENGPRRGEARVFGSKHYKKGWQFWEPGHFAGQSVRIHEKGARAFADVLKKYDIPAYADSRLD